jgi:hypothetical protein
VALSDEQNAMLRLLASGEQGYDDIAALLGVPVDEVRAKVIGALAQLEAEGKPAPQVPSPLPGGGAKPAAEVVPPEPEPVQPAPIGGDDAEPAVADAVAPRLDAPATPSPATEGLGPARSERAASPGAAPTGGPRSAPPGAGGSPPSGGRTITLPSGRNAWLLGGGVIGAIVVIVIVILLVSGGGGGDKSASTTTSETGKTPAAETAKSENGAAKQPTVAELTAVDGSEAKGVATFGRVKNKLALAVEVTGLEPTEEGKNSYTIWLAESPQKMLPLVSTGVKSSGKTAGVIAAEFEVPIEVLAYLANGTFDQIAITRTDNEEFSASVEKAKKEKTTPEYLGEEVLKGTITGPIVGLAQREEEAKKESGE